MNYVEPSESEKENKLFSYHADSNEMLIDVSYLSYNEYLTTSMMDFFPCWDNLQ